MSISLGGPMGYKHSLLGAKLSFSSTDIPNSLLYWAPASTSDGTTNLTSNATAANLNLFDGRMYRQIKVLWSGTFANAVTLKLECFEFDSDDATNAGSIGSANATSGNNGGSLNIITGTGTTAASAAADAICSVIHTFSPMRPGWFRLATTASGATGTVTSGRLLVYGVL